MSGGPRVLFVHGLESGPQGKKARELTQHFELHCEQMDTRDFAACVAQQAAAIKSFAPDVVVGSSFGGAVLLELLASGAYSGPALLLAPAYKAFGVTPRFPAAARVVVAHGSRDMLIDIEDSRRLTELAAAGQLSLHVVDDEHRLNSLLEDGRLVQWVLEVWGGGRAE